MNLFLEQNKIIIKEKKVCCDGNSYLTNLQEAWEKKKITSTTKIQAHNLQKFVEARGEYQTTRYSASKPLNTSYGDEIRVLLPPPTEPPQLQPALKSTQPNRSQFNSTQLNNNTQTNYISSTTTLQQITYPQQQYFNKLHIRNNKLNIDQSQVPQKGNQKISKIRYQVH